MELDILSEVDQVFDSLLDGMNLQGLDAQVIVRIRFSVETVL
jgi:hypothetical protein